MDYNCKKKINMGEKQTDIAINSLQGWVLIQSIIPYTKLTGPFAL